MAKTTSETIHNSNHSSAGKGFKRVVDIMFTVILLIVILLAVYIFQNKRTNGQFQVAGYQLYVVLSGSMSPTFDTGSVVIVKSIDPKTLAVGDIVTFEGATGTGKTITHRIIAISTEDGLSFTTRGDANNVADSTELIPENVIGKEIFSVPYLGYFLEFSKSKEGLYFLIVLPCLIIILLEIRKIFGYAKEKKRGNQNPEERVLEIEKRAGHKVKPLHEDQFTGSANREMPGGIIESAISNKETVHPEERRFIRKEEPVIRKEEPTVRKDEPDAGYGIEEITAITSQINNKAELEKIAEDLRNRQTAQGKTQEAICESSNDSRPHLGKEDIEKETTAILSEAQRISIQKIYQYTMQAENTERELKGQIDLKLREEEDLDKSIQQSKAELLKKLNSYEIRKENVPSANEYTKISK